MKLSEELSERVATAIRLALHRDYSHLSERDMSREIARAVLAVMDNPPDMRAAMIRAKEKLELYRKAHGGEYVGGVEYTQLIREIDAALK